MKLQIKITARLQNPTGVWEDDISAEIPDGTYRRAAITRTIMQIQGAGGLYRELDENHTNFIPMCRIADIELETTAIALADNLDLARAVAQQKGTSGLIQGA